MEVLDEAVRQARSDPRQAAEFFIGQLDDPQADLLTHFIEPPGFAHFPLATIVHYERVGHPVLIRGRWGEVWYTPADTPYYRSLRPPAPLVTPRGLRALGRGLIEVLADDEPFPQGLMPWE